MREPNLTIGEIGINEIILRPSFSAMASLDPLDQYATSVGRAVVAVKACQVPHIFDLMGCVDVLNACAPEPLPVEIVGEFVGRAKDYTRSLYRPGALSIGDVAVLANHLIKWGLYGEPDPLRARFHAMQSAKKEGDPIPEKFDILKFVGMAAAPNGLGKSIAEAWQMTMREFQIAWDAAHPLSEKDKAAIPPTEEEAAILMAQIEKARGK